MKLTELLTAPWAIAPESLREIQQIYATHCKGDKIDIAAVEARLGRPLANDQQAYSVREGGIAVLPIEGAMAPKANLFMQISGGASTQMLARQVESAMADSRVKGLVLAIDSPGGSVFGMAELAAAVHDAAKIKPVVAVSDGTIASAAYYVGSAANAVFLSGPIVHAGSIGVVARLGLSQADPESMEFTRGKYKRAGINGSAPDGEYLAYYEANLDHLYTVFVDAVAEHRGVSSDDVLANMADGRVFIGQQAIDSGLADGFATVDAIVEAMAANPAQFSTRRKAVFGPGKSSQQPAGAQAKAIPTEPVLLDNSTLKTEKETTMDRKELELQHPALFAQLKNEFSAEATAAATATATAAGAAAERQRIADVRAQSLTGHEALIEMLAADGKTTGPEAAVAVLAVERTRAAGAAAAHFTDAPAAASHAAAPSDAAKTPAVKATEATALAKSKGISVVAALKELGYA